MKKEYIFLLVLLIVYVTLRSIHFPYHLNFSADQASHARRSLEIWQNKELTLIGPSISFKYIGRELYTGSIFYYFQLLFLLPGRFDPSVSSYLFMLFGALMIIPLFYGTKYLVSQKAAFAMCILYALLPFYIDYSRFLWNPNAQFILTPVLILFIGLFAKYKKSVYLFFTGLAAGVLTLFHYQYLLIVTGLFVYYFLAQKTTWKNAPIFLLGALTGFSPLLIFELRNSFYNTQTLLLYLQNQENVLPHMGQYSSHYFISLSLFLFLIALSFLKKRISYQLLFASALAMLALLLPRYARVPTHGFGMAENWNYPYEKKVYETIRKENLRDFNIAYTFYDTVATVPKYLHKKDSILFNFDDYYHNRYLFVLSDTPDFLRNPAYEINTFIPSSLLKKWKINNTYTLYLLERV